MAGRGQRGGSTMKEWEVWCEGYQATGEHGQAHLMATVIATTFSEACAIAAREYADSHLYDSEWNTYGACRLFDNEADAREMFG